MKTAIEIVKLIVLLASALVFLLTAVLLVQTLWPSFEPSANGVSRLVDEQYNVLCYYSRFWGSCMLLKP